MCIKDNKNIQECTHSDRRETESQEENYVSDEVSQASSQCHLVLLAMRVKCASILCHALRRNNQEKFRAIAYQGVSLLKFCPYCIHFTSASQKRATLFLTAYLKSVIQYANSKISETANVIHPMIFEVFELTLFFIIARLFAIFKMM